MPCPGSLGQSHAQMDRHPVALPPPTEIAPPMRPSKRTGSSRLFEPEVLPRSLTEPFDVAGDRPAETSAQALQKPQVHEKPPARATGRQQIESACRTTPRPHPQTRSSGPGPIPTEIGDQPALWTVEQQSDDMGRPGLFRPAHQPQGAPGHHPGHCPQRPEHHPPHQSHGIGKGTLPDPQSVPAGPLPRSRLPITRRDIALRTNACCRQFGTRAGPAASGRQTFLPSHEHPGGDTQGE